MRARKERVNNYHYQLNYFWETNWIHYKSAITKQLSCSILPSKIAELSNDKLNTPPSSNEWAQYIGIFWQRPFTIRLHVPHPHSNPMGHPNSRPQLISVSCIHPAKALSDASTAQQLCQQPCSTKATAHGFDIPPILTMISQTLAASSPSGSIQWASRGAGTLSTYVA